MLLDEKNYTDALKLLDATSSAEAYAALSADLRGDVLSAQGKVEEARAAYKQALDKIEAQSKYRNMIQIKLDALNVQ